MNIVFDVTERFAQIWRGICNPSTTTLDEIKEIIIAMQDRINQLATQIEEAKTTIMAKIAEESQQVQDFIAAHPELDTTGLESAVAGLATLSESVSGIFPDAPAEEPPVEEPEA